MSSGSPNVRGCGIGFGSNLGDRLANLRKAREKVFERVATGGGGAVLSSPVFETEPEGCDEGTPAFLNAVVEVGSALEAEELLEVLLGIERELGRPADHGFNTPRTIDLDILYLGDVELVGERLTVPHPRMLERRFVLGPLSRIRPDLRLPGQRATVSELLAESGRGQDDDGMKEAAPPDWAGPI